MTPPEEAAWVVRAQCGDRDALEQLPTGERLRELLQSEAISPASRAVLLLHFQEEMPLAEVAAVLETDDSGSRLLFHALGAQILFVAGCTAVVMMHVTRMTKAILRALELKK